MLKEGPDLVDINYEGRSVHAYTPEEIAEMNNESILRYIQQVNKRYSVTPFIGEEGALDKKLDVANAELIRRKVIKL